MLSMKEKILLVLLTTLTVTASHAGAADAAAADAAQTSLTIREGFELSDADLVPAKMLKIRSLSDDISFSGIEVIYSSVCESGRGNFFGDPTGKSCGGATYTVPVGADGTVALPAMKKFKGFRARNADNYYIYFNIVPKEQKPMSPLKAYYTIFANGEKSLAQFAAFNETFNLVHIKPLKVDLLVEGQPLSQYLQSNRQAESSIEMTRNLPAYMGRASEMTGYGNGGGGIRIDNKDLQNPDKYTVFGFVTAYTGDVKEKTAHLSVLMRTYEGRTEKRYSTEIEVNPSVTKTTVNVKRSYE